MSITLILASLLFSLSLSIGQLLFKLAADDIKLKIAEGWLTAIISGWLFAAILLYAVSTVLWVAILTQVNLSKAYPFALLGAALVPLISHYFLNEQLTFKYVIGMVLVLLGVLIIQKAT